MRRSSVIFMLLAIATACVCRAASERDLTAGLSNSEVRATADNMYYLQTNACMVFETNVVVSMGEGTLYADKVVAHQEAAGKGMSEGFSKVVATGNVRLQTPDRIVRGATGTWNRVEKTIRISGNAMVREKGGREVTAAAILYDMAKERISFEGRARVRAVVNDGMKKDWTKL